MLRMSHSPRSTNPVIFTLSHLIFLACFGIKNPKSLKSKEQPFVKNTFVK